MTSEKDAPAGLPDEIVDANKMVSDPAELPGEIVERAWNAIADQFNQWPDLGQDEKDSLTRFAAAILAPILAEKEREIESLKRAHAHELDVAQSHLLAAEAALSAERERTTVAMARLQEYASDPDIALTLQGSPDKCEALQGAIAAAIRAQE